MSAAHVYDLYGSATLSIEEVVAVVESITGMSLQRRESLNMGGVYYRSGEVGGTELIVQHNADEDGEAIEPDFSEHIVLFRLDRSPDADRVQAALAKVHDIDFLRRD
jgi:hypothetical protein